MKLKFLFFVMALSAMGPGRDAPPPAAPNPARLPPVAQTAVAPEDRPAPAAPEVSFLSAGDAVPEDFLWTSRPIVVFADAEGDPAYVEQIEALKSGAAALAMRDAVVILDADPAADSIWRRNLHPRGFSLVLIDKDGQIKIRRPSPWDVREIGRAIDRLPLRRQEIGRGSVSR